MFSDFVELLILQIDKIIKIVVGAHLNCNIRVFDIGKYNIANIVHKWRWTYCHYIIVQQIGVIIDFIIYKSMPNGNILIKEYVGI